MVLTSDESNLTDRLKLREFVQMVRERYIVEFPRPSNSTPGQHGMAVTIAKGSYLIRAAGVSMPVPDAALIARSDDGPTGSFAYPGAGLTQTRDETTMNEETRG